MHPHMFAGMHDDEFDNEDDEVFDLSGWMSRSPPEGGLGHGHFDEPPMLEEEPTVRPRSRPRNNAKTAAQFTPPIPNPYQGIAGSPGFIKLESPFNPLWVDDASFMPKATLATKITGFSALVSGTAFYLVGRNAHNRVASRVNAELEYAAPFSKKLAIAGLFGYLHPVLGLDRGLLKGFGGEDSKWYHYGGKIALHGLGLVAAVAILRRA
jgi:hypothetical protein